MTESEKILSKFDEQQQAEIAKLVNAKRAEWVNELKPAPDAFGLKRMPRENPADINGPFLRVFKTNKHTYTIIGENGVGFERYTVFQKRSLLRGFATSFQGLYNTLQEIKLKLASEPNIGVLKNDAILAITGMQDSVAAFTKEQFDAALWLCTLFVLREDEKVSEYSEEISEEKMRDWSAYGYSELDFFLLSGSMVAGYGKVYQETITRSQAAKNRFTDAMLTLGSLKEKAKDQS